MKSNTNNHAHLTIRKDSCLSDGRRAILLRLKINGRKKDISLGEYCNNDSWNAISQRVKKNYAGSDRINDIIGRKLSLAHDIIFRYKSRHEALTIDLFIRDFGITDSTNFVEFIESEILAESKTNQKAKGTIRTYRSDLAKLKHFRQNIRFIDFNEQFLRQYEAHLRNDIGNSKNTIHRTMRFLKNFNNRAINRGYTNQNPFAKYQLLLDKTLPRFLDTKELQMLVNFYASLPIGHRYIKTLRPYLFCCYTGLRHSDISSLRFRDIQGDSIYFRSKKTSTPTIVPIINAAKELIGELTHIDSPIFKVPCNQITNRTLKCVALDVGITKTLTFHTARHTFATIGVNIGIDINVIRDLLGHTDIKQTMVYAKLAEKTKQLEMEKWNSFLVPGIAQKKAEG